MQSHASLTGFAREPRHLLVHEVNSALQLFDLEYLPRADISHGQKNGLVIVVQNSRRNRHRCWQAEKDLRARAISQTGQNSVTQGRLNHGQQRRPRLEWELELKPRSLQTVQELPVNYIDRSIRPRSIG
jgi:hypothetical protein